ncbi:hypothetical protein F511_25148 [Dorcoceras hygrometricum]|uniref:Uncharacterized protein n=1 Tax=Dorcoceras hygrometricum TaxID=472368 RepID=A0A2Z7CY15_9LAMI|nr:hypothetical protein F511_25148 [Dorcoceras hygrometricum]
MRTRGDKRSSRKHDRKVLVADESTKSWAYTDSESSSSSSSSSDSEQEEVHCLMAEQTSDDEVFDFSNVEFIREDIYSALNDMVKEYRKLSHSFKEVKAENSDLKNSSAEPSVVELGEDDSLKIELTNVIYDCCESMIYDDQTYQKLNHNGKAGIGFQKPENSKPSWLKNKLDKDKAKAGRKSFVPNQPWRSSTKVKSSWKKVQPKRDLIGQSMKSKLNRSHSTYEQTLMDSYTGRTVKVIQVWVPKGVIRLGPK